MMVKWMVLVRGGTEESTGDWTGSCGAVLVVMVGCVWGKRPWEVHYVNEKQWWRRR